MSEEETPAVMCHIQHDLLERAYFALETARDNAEECYTRHMEGLGTTTEKNKRLAGLYQDDLNEAEFLITELSKNFLFGR